MDRRVMTRAEELIQLFALTRHPEGGYYRSNFRSKNRVKAEISPKGLYEERIAGSSIYYLLTSNDFSVFHRLTQDEIWHFYEGGPLTIHTIYADGSYKKNILGNRYEAGQLPQIVIPSYVYFAAVPEQPDSYAFVGCSLAPGFEFCDMEIPERMTLLDLYPQHLDIITAYTR